MRVLTGVVGLAAGLASLIGLALAALAGPLLGLLALLSAPWRALIQRLRRHTDSSAG